MKTFLAFILAATLATVTTYAQDWAKARLEKTARQLEWEKLREKKLKLDDRNPETTRYETKRKTTRR